MKPLQTPTKHLPLNVFQTMRPLSFTSSLMSHLVVYATPREPLILAGVFITMLLLGLVATFVPARRTLAIDPAQLLRE